VSGETSVGILSTYQLSGFPFVQFSKPPLITFWAIKVTVIKQANIDNKNILFIDTPCGLF
jgi:hypothetical protein